MQYTRSAGALVGARGTKPTLVRIRKFGKRARAYRPVSVQIERTSTVGCPSTFVVKHFVPSQLRSNEGERMKTRSVSGYGTAGRAVQ